MAMAAYEYPDDDLAYTADHIDVPEGFRVEIIEGNIIVSPTPAVRHGLITSILQNEINAVMPSGLYAVQNITLTLPETGQQYIPDLMVLPRDMLDQEEWKLPADAAELVAEVTSPNNAEIDRVKKLRGYARSGVRVYLLVDRLEQTATLFTEPVAGVYQRNVCVAFGQKLPLPEPFSGEIDTSEFL